MTKLLDGFQLSSNKKIGHLSSGEFAKLKLCKAMSTKPQLLILDELTANLSLKSKDVVLEHIVDYFSTNPVAVLYINHHHEESIRLSDRVYTLQRDGLIQEEQS